MVDEVDIRRAPTRRWARAAAVVAIVAIVGYVVTRPSDTGGEFRATGAPTSMPPAGQLTEVSADEFESILVGQIGTPVIVNVWASWCAPCRTETPLLERTAAAVAGDVVILGVASKDTAGNARAFMDEFDVTYPNLFDASGDIRARLGLRGFPSTYVFGADGALRTTIVGGLTEQRLAAVLSDLGQ